MFSYDQKASYINQAPNVCTTQNVESLSHFYAARLYDLQFFNSCFLARIREGKNGREWSHSPVSHAVIGWVREGLQQQLWHSTGLTYGGRREFAHVSPKGRCVHFQNHERPWTSHLKVDELEVRDERAEQATVVELLGQLGHCLRLGLFLIGPIENLLHGHQAFWHLLCGLKHRHMMSFQGSEAHFQPH